MRTADLIVHWHKEANTSTSKAELENLFKAFNRVMSNELSACGEISFPGLGKLKVRQVKPSVGRNPRTGETIEIAARRKVVFVAGQELKTTLKRTFEQE